MDMRVVVSCLLLVAMLMVQGISGAFIPIASPEQKDDNRPDKCPDHCFCWTDEMRCEYDFAKYFVKNLAPWQPTSLKIFGIENLPMSNKLISLRYAMLKLLDGKVASVYTGVAVFSRLRQLDISYIPIYIIAREDFEYMPYLRILNVSNNGIQGIGKNAFADLSQLQVLDLSGNQLTSLNSEMFTGLESLEKLQLDGNALTSLSNNVFSMLYRLVDLSLNRNNLTSIDGLFNHMTALETLDIGDNQISFTENDTVSYLLTVGNAYLGKNPFQCSCISEALISAVQHNTSIGTRDMTCADPLSLAGNSILNLTIDSLPCESARVEEISPSLTILQQGNVELQCKAAGSNPVGVYWVTPWGDKLSHSSTQVKFPAETKNAVQERDIYGSNILLTTKLYVTRDGVLHIDKFRGSFAGNFTCVSVNKIGESNSTVNVGITSLVRNIYISSIFIGAYCAGSMLGVAIILGAIRYFVNKCLHKEGCNCCCCRCDDNEVDSVKFEEEEVEVTYSTGSLDTESDHDFSEFPPPDPPVNSPLRRKSPDKCRTPPDDLSDLEKESPHIWEQLDEVRSRLRLGAGRKIEKVRSHVRSFTDTGTLKIREMKDAGSMKIQSIKETSSQAASRVRKNVASGMVQVKYGVQSIKEFCGTGEMGPGTISMVSVSTDVDTKQQVKIIRSHTFV